MPIRGDVPFQRATIQVGGVDMDAYFYYDHVEDEWLSANLETFVFARNNGSHTGFLRSVNGVLLSSTFGPLLIADSKLVYLTASATAAPLNRVLHIHSNGSSIHNVAWSTASFREVINGVNLTGGQNISAEIQTTGAGGGVAFPLVTVGLRWRLP